MVVLHGKANIENIIKVAQEILRELQQKGELVWNM